MNQPTKDALREQLALAASEIIRLRAELSAANRVGHVEFVWISAAKVVAVLLWQRLARWARRIWA